MVSSDMASSSLEAAIDDALREPAEQESTGLSEIQTTTCRGPRSRQTGHQGQLPNTSSRSLGRVFCLFLFPGGKSEGVIWPKCH